MTNPAVPAAPPTRARHGRIVDGARLFAEAGSRLLSSLDADRAMSTLIRMAVPSFADWCTVYLLDEHGPNGVVTTAYVRTNDATGAKALKARSRPITDSRQGMVDILRTGCAELIPTLSDGLLRAFVDNAEQLARLRRAPSVSAMLVPLTGVHGVVGAACFISTAPSPSMSAYSRRDFEHVKQLGHMAGLAIENGRRFASVQRRPLSRLHTVVGALRQRAAAGIDSSLLISECVEGICSALDTDACAYLEYNPESQLLRLKGGVGWNPGLIGGATVAAFPDSFSGFALSSNDPVVVLDAQIESRFTISSFLREHAIVSGIAVAIRHRGSPVGVLGVYTRRRRRFTLAETGFIEEIAEILGVEIAREFAESEARSLKGELHSILGGITDGVLVQDLHGRIVYANAAAARTLDDLSIETLLATPSQELFERFRPAEVCDSSRDCSDQPPWTRALSGESVPGVLMRYQRSDASEARELVAGSRPVVDETGRVLRVITIIRDVNDDEHGLGEMHLSGGATSRTRTLQPGVAEILEAERRRVAYDIHDGLAQIATSAYQHLEAFADRYHALTPEERAELEQMRDLSRRTVREARRVIADLRPTVLDDFGLVVALREEIEELRKDGRLVLFEDSSGDERLPRHLEIGLFRVAQEALANARKHAGPTPIWVTLECHGTDVRLEVRDSGKGFDADAPMRECMGGERVGLIGMRERMALLGGMCVIASRPGEGTRVIAAVSLDA